GQVGTLNPTEVELMGMPIALHLFCSFLWISKTHLVIKTDSLNYVKWILNPIQRTWRFWKVFSDIDAFHNEIGDVRFIHMQREANGLTNGPAKLGLDRL
ncbi:hypothetical protein ES319_D01G188800v1, partial [Gossypium barbadense]